MSDQTATPEQQVQTPVQQAATQPPAGFIELARYNGLVKKVEELTLTNRSLTEQIALLTSDKERLSGELVSKDTERTIAVSERDKQLQGSVEKTSQLEKELAELRGLKLKVEVAAELGRPELISLAAQIPSLTDKEALKTVMGDIANFADTAVKAREKQLLSGVTPAVSSVVTTKVTPQSGKDWESHINALPLGSPERNKAWDEYYTFLSTQK